MSRSLHMFMFRLSAAKWLSKVVFAFYYNFNPREI